MTLQSFKGKVEGPNQTLNIGIHNQPDKAGKGIFGKEQMARLLLPKIKHELPLKQDKLETVGESLFVFEASNSAEKIVGSSQAITSRQKRAEKVKYPTPNVRKRLKEPVVCEICSKILKSKNFLKVHMQRHGEKTHVCDSCPKIFGDKSMLKRHVEKTHTQSKCEICLVSVFGLKKHMRLKHRKLTTCSNCGIESKCIWKHEKLCKMTEEQRAAYKEAKKVNCQQCGKVLANKQKLDRHIQTTHSKARLIKCEYCDHEDTRSDNMKTHVKNNHSDMVGQN